jgi:hypothetical protein
MIIICFKESRKVLSAIVIICKNDVNQCTTSKFIPLVAGVYGFIGEGTAFLGSEIS